MTEIFLWSVSIWYLIVGTAILPAIDLVLWIKYTRPRPGFCTTCGYDLRATPWRCPECGTVPEKANPFSN